MKEEHRKTPGFRQAVFKDTELKKIIVDYVGNQSEGEEVTVQMIVETMAVEFPEFLLPVAEENWIRGYKQALDDLENDKTFLENTEGTSSNDKLST
tara:strand:+ start:397 stop:684 length:288 start_codon:yes stop_codon:yes gene_type:complete